MKIIDSVKGQRGTRYVRLDNTHAGTFDACMEHGLEGHLLEPVTVQVAELKAALKYTGERDAQLWNGTDGTIRKSPTLRIIGPNGTIDVPTHTHDGPDHLVTDDTMDGVWSTIIGEYGFTGALKAAYPFILQEDDGWKSHAAFMHGYIYATNDKNMAKVPCTLPENVEPFMVHWSMVKLMLSVAGNVQIQRDNGVVYVRIGTAVFRVPQNIQPSALDVLDKFADMAPWQVLGTCSVTTTADSILIPAQRTHTLVRGKDTERRGTVLTFGNGRCTVDGVDVGSATGERTLIVDSTNLFAALEQWGPEQVTLTTTGESVRGRERFTDGFVRIDVRGTVYVVTSWRNEAGHVLRWHAPEPVTV